MLEQFVAVSGGSETELSTELLAEKIFGDLGEDPDPALAAAAARVTKAAVARAAHDMDPDESGVISFETWENWHHPEWADKDAEVNKTSQQMLGLAEEEQAGVVEEEEVQERKMGDA